jgi:DHA1 family inner membrane transport protein
VSANAFHRAAFLCAQMLPATMIVPAIRPWFASHHAGNESAMHAFMSVNMLAAALISPLIARMLRRWSRGTLIRVAAVLDALLLASFTLPLPTSGLLVLRAAEGMAHVTVLVALLTDASEVARTSSGKRTMAAAGAGLVAAIAFGSVIGTAVLELGAAAPFYVAAALAAWFAATAPRHVLPGALAPRVSVPRHAGVARAFLAPAAASFVSRFGVGVLVVTFTLLAHRVHGLDDREIGIHFSTVTVPFALAVYPVMQLGRRWSPRAITTAGVAGYAVVFLLLPWTPVRWLLPVMLAGGLSFAAVFGGVLVEAAAMSASLRPQAMALVNGAGCLGMVLGPTVAGIVSAVVGRGDPDGYRAALVIAAAPALVWVALSLVSRRAPEPIESESLA